MEQLRQALSAGRMQSYQRDGASDIQALSRYLWNISLGESLYPALGFIEITLRNSIHDAARHEFGDDFWFRSLLVGYEKSVIERMDAHLSGSRAQVLPGDFVSNLTFGFWVNLLSNRYEAVLWPRLLQPVFPHIQPRFRTLRNISRRFNSIRRLRNRVFHHEPIWNLPDLPQQHAGILEAIGWISPPMLGLAEMVDGFGGGYTRGAQLYAAQLRARLPRRRRPPGGTPHG